MQAAIELKDLAQDSVRFDDQDVLSHDLKRHKKALAAMDSALKEAVEKSYGQDMVLKAQALLEELNYRWSPLSIEETDVILQCAANVLHDPFNETDRKNLETLRFTTRKEEYLRVAFAVAIVSLVLFVVGAVLSGVPGAILIGASFLALGLYPLVEPAVKINKSISNAISFFKEAADLVALPTQLESPAPVAPF